MSERAEGTRRRLYGAQDMVRISSSSCAGCGACCRGMSDTIVPDPYDVWQMGLITGKTFEELMGAGIDLHVCRLFPLGRQYDEEKTSYFIVPEGCVKGGLSKVRIDKWLGIPDLPAYEDFKSRWHSFIRTLTARIAAEQSDETRRNINLYFLRLFFMQPYNVDSSAKTFYEDVADRMKRFADAVL